MVRAIFRKPLTYFWRKFRPLTLLKNIGGEIISHRMVVMHPQFFLVVLLMVSYTILITLFHIFDIRLIIQAVPSKLYQHHSFKESLISHSGRIRIIHDSWFMDSATG